MNVSTSGIITRFYIDTITSAMPSVRYDILLPPYTDPHQMAILIDGVDASNISVNAEGELVFNTAIGNVRQGKLFAYQMNKGDTIQIPCHFQPIHSTNSTNVSSASHASSFTFALGSYNPALPLVIDPLIYSTLLGGAAADRVNALAVDVAGAVYATGSTQSPDFPTTVGAYSRVANSENDDIVVSKISPNGSSLLYSTYIGGRGADAATSLAVDSAGAVVVAGYSLSPDYPTTLNAVQTSKNEGRDAVVTKLTPSGDALIYSTFLGGTGAEQVQKVVLGVSGVVTLAGSTSSTDFPTTPSAVQRSIGGSLDAFVTRINASGSGLVYSTFLGGVAADEAYALAVDAGGASYVGGFTGSANFPTSPSAYSRRYTGNGDVFLAKLNASGSGLVYSTFLGGSVDETCYALAVDGVGAVTCTGFTGSANFPTTENALQRLFGGSFTAGDAFVTKLNPSGSGLVYSTYLGGVANDYGYALALDSSGAAVVAGTTESINFPTSAGALQTVFGGGNTDIFLTKLNPDGSSVAYSTFLGGRAGEEGFGLALGGLQMAHIAGYTQSNNFPVTDSTSSLQTRLRGQQDGFVAKLQLVPSPPPFITGFTPPLLTAGGSNVVLTIQGGNFAPQARVRFGDSLLTPARIESTRILVTLPASVLALAGTQSIMQSVTVDNGNKLSTSASLTIRPQPVRILRANPSILEFDGLPVGTRSAPQRVLLSTQNLDSDLVITPPPYIEIARDSASAVWVAAPNALTLSVGAQSTSGSVALEQPLWLRFAPPATTTALGAFTELLRLQNSGAETGIIVRAIGLRVSSLLASTPMLLFDSTDVSAESRLSLTLRNIGTRPTRILTSSLQGDSSDFRLESVSSQRLQEITLQPRDSIGLTLLFRPTQRGLRTATVNFSDDIPPSQSISAPLAITLAGTGVQAAFSLVPPSLTFPPTYTTQRTLPVQTLTLHNDGNRTGRINAVRFSSGEITLAPQSSSLAFPVSVEAGTSISFVVQFKPSRTGISRDSVFVDVETKISGEVLVLTASTSGEGRLLQPPVLISPPQGTALANTPPQGASVQLRWEAVPSVSGGAVLYEVQIVKNDTAFSGVQPTTTVATTLAQSIEPETRYVWRVRAATQIPSGAGQEVLTSDWREWSFFTTQSPVSSLASSAAYMTGIPHDSLNFGVIPVQQGVWPKSLILNALPAMQGMTLDWLRNDANAFSVSSADRVRLEHTPFSARAPQMFPIAFRPPNTRQEPFQAVLRVRAKHFPISPNTTVPQEMWLYCVGRAVDVMAAAPAAELALAAIAPQTPAYPKDSVRLQVRLNAASQLDSVRTLRVFLRVENSSLFAMDTVPQARLTRGIGRIIDVKRLAGDGRSIVLDLQRPQNLSPNQILGEITGIATLGTTDSTRVVADELRWLDANGQLLSRHVLSAAVLRTPLAAPFATTLVVNSCPADAVPRRVAFSQTVSLPAVQPNPVFDEVEISYSLRDRAWTELALTDMLGREVQSFVRGMVEPGQYVLRATLNDLPQGSYVLVLRTPFEVLQQRVHILR
jgi:hypothetical protein